jgi:dethiobiotin synthetase
MASVRRPQATPAARGLFVTGTGTGVGKSVLAAALLSAMAVAGERVRAYKPVLTGLAHGPEPPWPADHELLGTAADMPADDVAPLRFAEPLSPHLAAALAGEWLEPALVRSQAATAMDAAASDDRILVVEGVGGLLVPLTHGLNIGELAAHMGLPLVIAALAGLGTINHTLLTIEAARTRKLRVAAVVLGPLHAPGAAAAAPEDERERAMVASNVQTIAELGRVAVYRLDRVSRPEPAQLARAGSALPWRDWL